MRIGVNLIFFVSMLVISMSPALSKEGFERVREGFFANAFLNVAAIAEPQGSEAFYALVAPSTAPSITVQRPLKLAKISLSHESELSIAVMPLQIDADGDSWRRHPLLTVRGQHAVVAYDYASKTRVARVNLVNGVAHSLPDAWIGTPVAVFMRDEDILIVTTMGVFLSSHASPIVGTSTCSPLRAAELAADNYVLFCGTPGREIHVRRMVLASGGVDRDDSPSVSILGSIHGIFSNAELPASSPSIVISDPQTKTLQVANVDQSGNITYTSLETSLDPSAKMAVVSAGDMVFRGVRAQREGIEVLGNAGNRPKEKILSFKDTDGRVAHVRGVRPISLGGTLYVIVETQLVALRGLGLREGVNNASRISMIPID